MDHGEREVGFDDRRRRKRRRNKR